MILEKRYLKKAKKVLIYLQKIFHMKIKIKNIKLML